MSIKIALAGNPNSGKTTMFNSLTGSNQRVGNWPGVTVEKKEGRLKGNKDVVIQDLPGIYSLSPYTLEEVVTRYYVVKEQPDAIINIVDASNIERNLYLTTQLTEIGVPVVIALNMIDVVKKNGDVIDAKKLGAALGCQVVETSALKDTGSKEVAEMAIATANSKASSTPRHTFAMEVETALEQIADLIRGKIGGDNIRWYSIKIFERDKEVLKNVSFDPSVSEQIEEIISDCEAHFDDDSESIITNERYTYITNVVKQCVKVKNSSRLSVSDKIDKIVTNRILALPIFAVVMFLVYYLSVSTVGTMMTDWVNDGVFGDGFHLFTIGAADYEDAAGEFEVEQAKIEAYIEAAAGSLDVAAVTDTPDFDLEEPDPADFGVWVPGIPALLDSFLTSVGTADWLSALILDGIVAGVGAVLGFLPQMLVLFLCLAILEDCGYMSRIAFIMDRIFRKFGLSGKSFIPMLISTGCGVPGIMASRTIENDSDRRMTVMTTTFIPCGAKLPIIALIAGALFDNSPWVAASSYFLGVAAVVISGIILKKTRLFAGDPAPFVMELPAYHAPKVMGVLRSMLQRGWAFVKKAGTLVLLATVLVWFLSSFNWKLEMVDTNDSILAALGGIIAPLFIPLGWGDWRGAVATITGLIAKENVVGTFGVLFHYAGEVSEDGTEIWNNLSSAYTPLAAYSFLVFNLLCAPCFAAMGALRREMMSGKWTAFAIAYQCVFAYAVALIIYQIGMLFAGSFGVGTVVAMALIVLLIYMLFRKPYSPDRTIKNASPQRAVK